MKIHTTILFQLRTGYIALNAYLYRLKKANSPQCERCFHHETAHHYILHCSRYDRQRNLLRRTVGSHNMTLEKLMTTRKWLPALIEYVNNTKRLHSSFQDIPPLTFADDDEDDSSHY